MEQLKPLQSKIDTIACNTKLLEVAMKNLEAKSVQDCGHCRPGDVMNGIEKRLHDLENRASSIKTLPLSTNECLQIYERLAQLEHTKASMWQSDYHARLIKLEGMWESLQGRVFPVCKPFVIVDRLEEKYCTCKWVHEVEGVWTRKIAKNCQVHNS